MMTKAQIRNNMKAFLAKLSPEERHARSLAACERLAGVKEFRNAQMIMMFLSMDSEVETSALALSAWREGKSIAVPRVEWDAKRMEPVEIRSLDTDMQTTGPGVREPVHGTRVPLALIDMVVIPGLAFDRRGYRVGRGRGFYDRFLAQKDFKGTRCALCYHEQIVEAPLPVEPHDVPMHLVVTDQAVLHLPVH